MSEQENKGKLNIELPEEVATGVYANLAVITHSPAEFVMDFIQVMPGMPKAKVRSRVVMSPHHVKRLLGALAENVQRFESNMAPFKIMVLPILACRSLTWDLKVKLDLTPTRFGWL